eukprot:scaffold19.g1815.t1
MFERLLSGPRPWRFGHLLLPGGSRNLGSEEYALAPGSQAPLVGTLMEAVRFPDGRLLVLAAGLSRIRVARVRQTVPHGVADVALLPDWEEAEAQHAVAASALCPDAAAAHQDPEQHLQQEDGVGSEGLATTSARRARAAAAAAAAETSAWQEYQLSGARVVDRLALVDGSDAQEAQAFGRQLVAISNNEYLPLPYWTSVLAAAASGRGRSGSPGAGVAPSSRGEWGEEVARELQDATAAAAAAAATAAEAAVAASGSAAFSSGWDVWPPGAWPHPPPGLINSTAERGVPWHPPSGVLADSEEEQEQQELAEAGPSGSVAVLLERRVWRELATISGLLHKVHGKTLQLSEGLHCLQPPPDADGASLLMSELGDFGADDSSSEADKDEGGPSGRLPAVELPPGWAHPAYPALRRAQRLSYALANLLPTFSGSEARQALLEAGSTAARLRMIVAGLREVIDGSITSFEAEVKALNTAEQHLLRHWRNLSSLELRRCQLDAVVVCEVDMAALGTLHSLRELRLEKCDLRVDERCTSAVLARLSELRELCLGWRECAFRQQQRAGWYWAHRDILLRSEAPMIEPAPGESPRRKSPEPKAGEVGTPDVTATPAPRRRVYRTEAANASQLYAALAVVLACAALPLIFLPKPTARFMFGSAAEPPEDQHKHLLQINAGCLLASAAVAAALEELARHHQLHTFTAGEPGSAGFRAVSARCEGTVAQKAGAPRGAASSVGQLAGDTLKLGLAALAAGNILIQLYYPATLTALAALLAAIGNAALLALPVSQLVLTRADRARVWRDFRTTLHRTFGYVFGKSTQFLWKMAGEAGEGPGEGTRAHEHGGRTSGIADATALTSIALVLKDKAENNLLGRSTARILNIGLLAAAILHILVLGPILSSELSGPVGHGGWMLPLLVTNWGAAMAASMLGLASSPEVQQLVERTAEAARTE